MKTILLTLAALAAAGPALAAIGAKDIDRALARIVAGKGAGDPVAGAALAVFEGDRLVYAGAAGCAEYREDGRTCDRPLAPEMKLRAASISKMALAFGLKTLIDAGKVDPDRDVSDYLGWRLRNPAFAERPITVRQLLSHTSSIRDPEEYWVDAPGVMRSLFDDPAAFAPVGALNDQGPGAWFHYANLNYGVLAGVIEGVTGERFDLFMQTALFAPLGIEAGYNWSGVPLEARRSGAALHQRENGLWRISVDDTAMRLIEPAPLRAAPDLDLGAYLASYEPGSNPTLFSPQGGLRASVLDLGRLAMQLRRAGDLTAEQWRYDPAAPNGETDDGYYAAFGMGVQIVKGAGDFFRKRTIIGHPGEAYGLYSGAWVVEAEPGEGFPNDLTIAFAITGTGEAPGKGAHPSFNVIEDQLMRLAMAAAYADEADVPAPFDEQADARAAVDAAFANAAADGRKVLMILGGNWCHDSRALARRMTAPALAALIEENFHTVFVDVGRRDRNLWLPRRFDVGPLAGTPTVLISDAAGALLNRERIFELTTADSQTVDAITDYFESYVEGPSKSPAALD